jgi:transcriptional regulator with XRE-family HTH domain
MAQANTKTLRELREEHKWTTIEYGTKVGLSAEQVLYWEKHTPDIHILRKSADAFGVAPEDITLSPDVRLIKVDGYRFLLTTHRDSSATWQARVGGVDFAEATEWAHRPVDPAYPDVDAPSMVLHETWRETGPSAEAALDALSTRVTSAMERALHPHPLPGDPPDWEPKPEPEDMRRRREARQSRQLRRRQ